MKAMSSTIKSSSWILLLTLLVALAPNFNAIADSSAVAPCSAHGELSLPDSPTGRMVHAFIDLTYTTGEDALQAFLEENLAPASRERNGDEDRVSE